jgi:hypothetical protein
MTVASLTARVRNVYTSRDPGQHDLNHLSYVNCGQDFKLQLPVIPSYVILQG